MFFVFVYLIKFQIFVFTEIGRGCWRNGRSSLVDKCRRTGKRYL